MEGMPVVDALDRPLGDLRISVTDRCNFRCTYCMPREAFGPDHAFLPRPALLSYEEIARTARVFVGMGVSKIRLTGGEPLLRRNLERLVEMLAAIDGVDDLSLTTNGTFLAEKAQTLKDAGLQRVTVSLDSLEPGTFEAMNDVDFPVERVLAGIEAAASVGLVPVKINCVVRRGVNEDQILPLARYFKGSGHVIRFIEYMDVGATNEWHLSDVVSAKEIVELIHNVIPLRSRGRENVTDVAERYAYEDGSGEIGVIASVTRPFCGDCSRARLSADGRLFTCLFATAGTDLRGPLRAGASDSELSGLVGGVWRMRTDRYSEERGATPILIPKIEMSFIGG
jgi:cyclic pyranopterin phosphate synthase